MNFKIKCHPVNCTKEELFGLFDQKLFEFITQGFPPTRVIRFDGCKTGDIIEIQLHMLIKKSIWSGKVTEDGKTPNEIYFVDEGEKMPLGLKFWRHVHHIIEDKGSSYVVEDITFKTGFFLLDWIYFIPFYIQFSRRKKLYKKYAALKKGG